MGETPGQPEGEFRRDEGFDPHLARVIAGIVRQFKVSIDQVAGKMNGRYRSDPLYDRKEPVDFFKDTTNPGNKPEEQ